ncbi:MAG: hypothetical protein Q9157_007047 [Trypethelium eluteriae]
MPPPEEIVKEMLLYLLDPKDTDRAFVKFDPSDDVAMLINNLGGLSNLELEALTNIVETQLKNDWNLAPKRIYVGTFETSLNGPGFSVTLGNLSSIARGLNMTSAEIFELLDAPTTAPAWPKNGYGNIEKRQELNVAKGEETETQSEGPIRESFLHTFRPHNWRTFQYFPQIFSESKLTPPTSVQPPDPP